MIRRIWLTLLVLFALVCVTSTVGSVSTTATAAKKWKKHKKGKKRWRRWKKGGRKPKKKDEEPPPPKVEELPPIPKAPVDPAWGIPIYKGVKAATKDMLRAMGLDSYENYKVGAFFTNDDVMSITEFYIQQLGATVKKNTEDGLKYEIYVKEPSNEAPLGEKVVIHSPPSGVKDEEGTKYKTLVTVYRLRSSLKPVDKPKAVEKKPEATKDAAAAR